MPAIVGMAMLLIGGILRFSVGGGGVAAGAYNGAWTLVLYIGGALLVFGCAYSLPKYGRAREAARAEAPSAKDTAAATAESFVIDLRTPATQAQHAGQRRG